MQNKALIYGIAVIVLLGIAWFAFRGGALGSQQASVVTSQNGESPVTLKDLLARGGTQICTFNNTVNGANTSGTVYIQSGKLRGDFNTDTNGQKVAGHIIVADNTSYFWTDLIPQGFKAPATALGSSQGSSQGSVDANLPMQYTCKPWSADASVFVVPKSISFQDLPTAQ